MGCPSGDRIMSNVIAPFSSLSGSGLLATGSFVPTTVRSNVPSSAVTAAPEETPQPQTPLLPNPSFRIDAALGLVVMELHDASGKIASTIPTTQQLDAYRRSFGQATAQQIPGSTTNGSTTNGSTTNGTTTNGTTTTAAPGTGAAPSAAAQTASAIAAASSTSTTS